MYTHGIISSLALLTNFFVGSFVFGQRRKDAVNRAFLLFNASTSLWILGEVLVSLPCGCGLEALIFKINGIFWIPIGTLFLAFVYKLLSRRFDRLFISMAVLTAATLVLHLSTDLIVRYETVEYDWGITDVRGPLHTWSTLVPGFAALYGLVLIGRAACKTADPNERGTFWLLLLGGTIGLVSCIAFNVVIPNILDMKDVIRLGSSSIAVFGLFLYRAIVRYNFLSVTAERVAEDLFEDAADGIILADRQGRIQHANRSVFELLGLNGDKATGRAVSDLLSPRLISGDSPGGEFTLDTDDGRHVLTVSTSTVTRGKFKLGKIILLRDITEQKRAEEVLRRSRDEAEEEAARRTDELNQAQRMEAIGTLASGIVHDINNALSLITGSVYAARRDLSEQHAVHDNLSQILEAVDHTGEVVRQILSFSRREKSQHKNIDVAAIIEEALGLINLSLPNDTAIERRVVPNASAIFGDPVQITQVIMNLGINSCHAMKKTGGVLRVELDEADLESSFTDEQPPLRPGKYIRIVVSDNGQGMNQETMERIFNPFFSTKSPEEGTGLGLATVKRIVASHGGAITVRSTAEVGTTFSVYLPTVTI